MGKPTHQVIPSLQLMSVTHGECVSTDGCNVLISWSDNGFIEVPLNSLTLVDWGIALLVSFFPWIAPASTFHWLLYSQFCAFLWTARVQWSLKESAVQCVQTHTASKWWLWEITWPDSIPSWPTGNMFLSVLYSVWIQWANLPTRWLLPCYWWV